MTWHPNVKVLSLTVRAKVKSLEGVDDENEETEVLRLRLQLDTPVGTHHYLCTAIPYDLMVYKST